jgi:NADPH-dependent 2,4-dienoyl-CoA reductase/sulfur reductase-like enzyme
MTDHVDLLIVGAGPAGLAAALAAAPSGARIALLDDNPAPGGQIWRDGPNARLPAAARELRGRVSACSNVQLHSGTRVVALAGERRLLVENKERGWVIGYERLILCTGARELLLPFPGWTLPGVTGAGGLQALIKGGLPVRDERLVVAGSGPLLLASAATARDRGAQVVRIAEQASSAALAAFAAGLWRWPAKAVQALGLFDARYRSATRMIEAFGEGRLEGVRLERGGRIEEIRCERLAAGFGLLPNTRLGQALGCRLAHDAIAVDAWQATSVAGHYAAGECTGFGGSEKARVEGTIAGLSAVDERDAAQRLWPRRRRWHAFAHALERHFALDPRLRNLPQPDTLVCRCEDVTYAEMAAHGDWRDAKLARRCGMGACQGRVCGSAARFLFGWELPAPRPPFSPARIETLLQLEEPAP